MALNWRVNSIRLPNMERKQLYFCDVMTVVMETAGKVKEVLSPTYLKRFIEFVECGCAFSFLVEKSSHSVLEQN